jgi:EmrB/QacA subfamily drug resistance transporter
VTNAIHAPCEEGLIRAVEGPAPPASAPRKRLILAATIAGSAMAYIDSSVVNVALPAIQHGLNADAAAVQWVANAYLLMLGALVLVGGAAADLVGRRAVFVAGILLFTLASIACGAAPNADWLIAARAVQGVGAALLTPASLAILGASFSDAERGRAIGAWAGFGALTTAAGPVLGGWAVDALSWRAVFFLNVPVAAVTLALTLLWVPESRDPQAKRLDIPGAVLAALGLGALTWGLTNASTGGFARPAVLWPLAIGVASLSGFLVVEARSATAMAPLSLFRSRDFSGANLLTLLLYFALGGALFFLPFELIRAQGYAASAAGAALLPLSVIMGGFSGAAGRLSDRIGPRVPLTLGPLIAAGGLLLLAAAESARSYWTGVFPAMLVVATGMTLAVAPLTTTVMSAVGERHAGVASGVNNALARVAGLLSIALLSLVFLHRFDVATAGTLPAGSGLSVVPIAAPEPLRSVEIAAFDKAFTVVMRAAAAAAAAGGVAAWLLVEPRKRQPSSP